MHLVEEADGRSGSGGAVRAGDGSPVRHSVARARLARPPIPHRGWRESHPALAARSSRPARPAATTTRLTVLTAPSAPPRPSADCARLTRLPLAQILQSRLERRRVEELLGLPLAGGRREIAGRHLEGEVLESARPSHPVQSAVQVEDLHERAQLSFELRVLDL